MITNEKQIKKPRIYWLPLNLVTRGKWRDLTKTAKAILPVLGLHADDCGVCWPSRELISELSGIKKLEYVDSGLNCLRTMGLMDKRRRGRKNIYTLKENAIRRSGSYFPMTEGRFTSGWWAKLKPCEKAVFVVLAVKGTIVKLDSFDLFPLEYDSDEIQCYGYIRPKRWQKLTGICRRSWYTGLAGLEEDGAIRIGSNNQYMVYKYSI